MLFRSRHLRTSASFSTNLMPSKSANRRRRRGLNEILGAAKFDNPSRVVVTGPDGKSTYASTGTYKVLAPKITIPEGYEATHYHVSVEAPKDVSLLIGTRKGPKFMTGYVPVDDWEDVVLTVQSGTCVLTVQGKAKVRTRY